MDASHSIRLQKRFSVKILGQALRTFAALSGGQISTNQGQLNAAAEGHLKEKNKFKLYKYRERSHASSQVNKAPQKWS
jgi:predicted lipoprotein with Yx(FWY)xxD motif